MDPLPLEAELRKAARTSLFLRDLDPDERVYPPYPNADYSRTEPREVFEAREIKLLWTRLLAIHDTIETAKEKQ